LNGRLSRYRIARPGEAGADNGTSWWAPKQTLHAELAGKLLANKREAIRLRTAMMQVEAVVKMLQPGFNIASIAAKRRNKSNPWFKARDAL
jgi:hypothetical protein